MADTPCRRCGRPVTGELHYVGCTVAVLCDFCSVSHKLVPAPKDVNPFSPGETGYDIYPPMWERDSTAPGIPQRWTTPTGPRDPMPGEAPVVWCETEGH